MKKITFLSLLVTLVWGQISFSQSTNTWQSKGQSELTRSVKPNRKTVPTKYKVFTLDNTTLRAKLALASKRDENNNLATTVLLDFPFDDGSTETFSIERVSVLAPSLESKYTEIRSYYGVSRKNPLNKIYITMDPGGFTGLITGEKTIYIDPYNFKNNGDDYIVYDRSNCIRNPNDPFVCNADVDTKIIDAATSSNITARNVTDGKLRTYELAVACTSEYSFYYGNTLTGVLAAINTTITRVNSVYRRDFAVVFQLVPAEDRLIYINNVNKDTPTPDPDPYDNFDGSQMLGANTGNITGLITATAYDIGHVFSTGGGGIASTGPCATTKGQGVTGIVTPQFDPFDIDYVCHEMGHQFGAGHTQNNNCQRATASAMEPGSASTIMGYAGICAPNVQGNSDAYFHAISISQMSGASGIAGHTCETETVIANTAPVATGPGNFTIPKSTPFTLTGSATDANGDALTYNWEQMNNETTGTMPPVATNPGSPNFRSFFATTSPSRTFPNMAAIVANTTPTWEVLPSVARTLNFRMTVRDNNSLGGQTNQANSVVTVSAAAGPFIVTAPNAGTEIWYVGETTRTVTWNVASTTAAPVSTANVKISLSTDGGFTYPVVLLASTANDGSENITVPNNIGKTMRIKVEAVGNIYFDISNADFEIKANTFELTTTQSTVSTCKPTSAAFTVNYTPAPTFSGTTTFSVTGLPSGATAAFSNVTLNASGSTVMTVNGIGAINAGSYNLTFTATSGATVITLPLTLKVFDNNIATASLTSPTNGAGNQQTSCLLQWTDLSSASSYLVQISTDPTFATITESATVVNATSYQTTLLTQGTINYWRVKPINPCLQGAFSEVYSFQIANDLCRTYNSVYFDNIDAASNNTWETNSTNAVAAKINVTDNIEISDVNFTMVATHPLLSDIKMQFSGPTGIFAEIYNRDCSGANFNVTFDDDLGTALPIPCTTGLTGTKLSSQALSKFDGSTSLGVWTLLATDRVSNTSGGTFTSLSIQICGKLQIVNNVTATVNDISSIQQGATVAIPQSKLLAAQTSATATQLIYVITQLPVKGALKLSGTTLTLGSTFTQADINNNLLTYVHTTSLPTLTDKFKFSVKGNNTALLGGQVLNFNFCSITNTASQTNVSCFGATTGTASVVPTSGTAPYTYDWTPGTPTGDGTATATGLIAGSWTCNIVDAAGCVAIQNFTITQPTSALSVVANASINVNCFGGNTGSASVTVSGGTAPYTYDWTGTPTGDATASVSGLTSGTWVCSVTDAKGCTASFS
ncbi:MAG: M12 family metallo-peptidase, partial [Flavobacterium sp.]|nr:M12 family metallo-peptidase [Flavobacterium sp.]